MKDKITLATGHAHAFHRVNILAAIDNGYFKDEGLTKIDLRTTGGDSLTVGGLKSGDIDFGLDVRPNLVFEENSKGEGLYIVAGMLNRLDQTFVGAPEIKSIADLRGKKIGGIEGGGGRGVSWVRILLRKEGIDPDKDVIWRTDSGYTSLDIQGPRLDQGDYQAICLTAHHKRPELFERVRQAGYNILAERSETYPGGLPDRAVVATGKLLDQYPQIVKRVLKGIVRGYRFARDARNAGKIRELYLSYDWGKDGFGWGKFDEALLDGMVRSAKVLPADGSISQDGLETLIEEYKVSGKLPRDFTKEKVLRLGPLQEAVRELNVQFGPDGYE